MPARKRVVKKDVSEVQKGEVSSTSLLNITCKSLDATDVSIQGPMRITKSLVEEKLREKLQEIDEIEKRVLKDFDHLEAQILMTTPVEKLKAPVSLDKLSDFAAILDESIWDIIQPAPLVEVTPASSVQTRLADRTPATAGPARILDKPPGSERNLRRSISHTRLSAIVESSPRRRSLSAEAPTPRNKFATPSSALETPANRFLPSRMLMTNKYTVRKPLGPAQPSIPMKRVMRAGEEAISTSGSPLFVQGRVPKEPEINIPLNNGVIINIDPNNPEMRVAVPHFDEETVKKIRILCRKLESCIGK